MKTWFSRKHPNAGKDGREESKNMAGLSYKGDEYTVGRLLSWRVNQSLFFNSAGAKANNTE